MITEIKCTNEDVELQVLTREEAVNMLVSMRNECGQGLSQSIVSAFLEPSYPNYTAMLDELVEEGVLKAVNSTGEIWYCPNDDAYCIEEYHGTDEEFPECIHFMRTFIGQEDEPMPFYENNPTRNSLVLGEWKEDYSKWQEKHKEELAILKENLTI
jgi:hypothetical protein